MKSSHETSATTGGAGMATGGEGRTERGMGAGGRRGSNRMME